MKLFQQLLVAPAAIGLLAPLSASASEINLDAISKYSEDNLEIEENLFKQDTPNKTLLSGGEGLVDSGDFTGGFSETTTDLSVLILLLVLKMVQLQRQHHLATKWVSAYQLVSLVKIHLT